MVYSQDSRDVDLIQRCLRGETAAFGELVEAYHVQVFRAAYRIVGDRDEAADVTQTVFLKAFEQLRKFDPNQRFFTWLYTIAVRTSLNAARRRTADVPLDDDVDLAAPEADRGEHAERQHFLRTALAELPADLRAPLVLFHYDDCSYREIADLVGTTETRVKSRIFEARKRLRQLLQRNGYDS